ncbi:hypothetical protein Dimus_017950 [Dionaea muscipula]
MFFLVALSQMMFALIRPTCFTTITEGQRRRRQGPRETSELVTVFFCVLAYSCGMCMVYFMFVYFLFPVGWPEAFVGFLCVLVVVDGLRLILVVSYYVGCAWK